MFLLAIEIVCSGMLLIVNFFRFNLLFVVAGFCVNIAIALNPSLPKEWMMWAFYLIALGELIAGVTKAIKQKRGISG